MKILDGSLKMWDNVTITGCDYSGGGINQLLEINMVDKNTNSLKQLFKYLVTMGALAKEKQKSYFVGFDNSKDSATVIIQPKVKK